MEKIHAWIYNPDHALMKGMSKKVALFELHCEDPKKCGLHANHNNCLLQGAFNGCKFGRKVKKEGPTKRARKYYDWIAKAREDNKGYFDSISTGSEYRGISKIHDHWYLPYSYMSDSCKDNGFPIHSQWVHEDDMTAELLERICEAKPRYIFEYKTIAKYQDETVPRFLHDLKTHHPELLALLPKNQRDRVENISFIGREADITTCAAGNYRMGTDIWEWDGSRLVGGKMLFQPAKGKIRIEIEPDKGQSVKITSNDQVTPETVFLD